jgi:hypothetical protein
MKARQTPSIPHSPIFWATLLVGSGAVILLAVFSSTMLVIAVVGLLAVACLAMTWEVYRQGRLGRGGTHLLDTPLFLAHHADFFERYRAISYSLLRMCQNSDTVYRSTVLEQLEQISDHIARLADGTIVYEGTETWRIAYENVLRSHGIYLYRSVAWVKTPRYWQDEPGRQSMRLNFELHDARRLNVERIVILADEVWPKDEPLPKSPIQEWIHEQHIHGIWTKLVRQSALESEPHLLVDMGIYGTRAVGVQELDDQCKTVRFTLTFDIDAVAAAEQRWHRLSVYATSYRDLLDHFSLNE